MGENACFIDYYALSLLILGLIHKKIVTNKTYCNLNTLDKVLEDMSVQARGILDYIESLTL